MKRAYKVHAPGCSDRASANANASGSRGLWH